MEGPEHLINAIDKIFVAEVVTDNLIKVSSSEDIPNNDR